MEYVISENWTEKEVIEEFGKYIREDVIIHIMVFTELIIDIPSVEFNSLMRAFRDILKYELNINVPLSPGYRRTNDK